MEKLTKDDFVKLVVKHQRKKQRKHEADVTAYSIESKIRMKRLYDGRNLRSRRG